MKFLEIIQVRSTGQAREFVCDLVRETLVSFRQENVAVTVYRRTILETDLSVHILHKEPSTAGHASTLGLRLASALREYGLVEHTVWEVMN